MTKNVFAAVVAAGLLASCAVAPAFAAECRSPDYVRHFETAENGAVFVRSFTGEEASRFWDIAVKMFEADDGENKAPPKPATFSGASMFVEPDGAARVAFFTNDCVGADVTMNEDRFKKIWAAFMGRGA